MKTFLISAVKHWDTFRESHTYLQLGWTRPSAPWADTGLAWPGPDGRLRSPKPKLFYGLMYKMKIPDELYI